MKVHVEWGRPKFATKRQICGMSGQALVENPTQAFKLGLQLFHVMCEGSQQKTTQADWTVNKDCPRKVVWAPDHTAWVAITLADGVSRGGYAGVADAEAARRVHAENAAYANT